MKTGQVVYRAFQSRVQEPLLGYYPLGALLLTTLHGGASVTIGLIPGQNFS